MIVSDSYIRAHVLVGFPDFVRELDGDPDAMLREADIDPAAAGDIDRLISFSAAARLCEIAATRLNRPNFGLDWALRMQPHFANTGPMFLLNLFMRDVRDWVETVIRFYHFNCNGYALQVIEEADIVRGRYFGDPLAFWSRQQLEHGFANAALAARAVLGDEHGVPVAMRFRHARPKDISVHRRVFGCPVEFDADHDEIVYARAVLDRPIGGNLRLLKPLVDQFIRFRLNRLPSRDQSMTMTVALAIPGVLGAGKCNAEFVAGLLGVKPKKLQRLLAAEGATFSDILDRVRQAMARRLLEESDAPASRIAGLLDYSAPAPFTIAFRRWTGQSPTGYRRESRMARAAE